MSKLTNDCAIVITSAQNLLSAVKPLFPGVKHAEGPELGKMSESEAAGYVIWLLGSKVPRLARAERTEEARRHLVLAQGILLGMGAFSRHDVHLCTVQPPPGRAAQKAVPFSSLAV